MVWPASWSTASLDMPEHQMTAIIGPSGSGKSTLLRCLNRMHEAVVGARVTGSVTIAGQDIYGESSNSALVRRHVGMIFQRPNPLPTRSIYENVALGPRLLGVTGRASPNWSKGVCTRRTSGKRSRTG